jgi:regulator of PEP synthase PpsR (kinase-PPPase family)
LKAVTPAPPPPRGVREPTPLYVLSDSTGNLARHTLAALLTQFPPGTLVPQFHAFVRTAPRLAAVLERIRAAPGAVCHAMVSDALKRDIAAFCRAARLPHYDLTGGLTSFLAGVCGKEPHGNLDSLHRIDEGYKRRIGAIEYTIGHDDGLGLETLADADVVLAGVSRTGKTPTSIYLAQQGFRVANVALAVESPPPPELLRLPPGKVVGLIIDPQNLVLIRDRRATAWRLGKTSYGDPAHVEREVAWARRLFARHGWPTLDVTDQAIEETAAKIVDLLRLTPAAAAGDGDLP